MAKYNLTPKKEKVARYQTLLSDKLQGLSVRGNFANYRSRR